MSMFMLDIGDPLSFSVMIYSRKCIRDFIKRKNKISSMMEYTPGGVGSLKLLTRDPKWIISPLLKAIHRVKSDVNSNMIWDNPPELLHQYKGRMLRDPTNSQYRNDYISLVAGFDKIRYWSPVRYLADVLHTKGIVAMDGERLMGYICFASLETNGTFLLAGIVDDAICTQDPRNCPFVREVEMFGMYAAALINLCSTKKKQEHRHRHCVWFLKSTSSPTSQSRFHR
jgi:hypothetical protein